MEQLYLGNVALPEREPTHSPYFYGIFGSSITTTLSGKGGPFTIFAIFLWRDHILAVASPERGALSPPLSWSIRDTKTGGGGGGARRGEGEGAKGGGQLLKRSIKRFHILGIRSYLIF